MLTFGQEYQVYIIWVVQDIYTPLNQMYFTELNNIINNNNNKNNNKTNNNNSKFEIVTNVKEAMEKIKQIKFIATIIILSGDLCINFIVEFCNNMKDIYIIPNIIIFTNDVEKYDQIIKKKIF